VGVEVGIAHKKWGSNASCAPRTRKNGGGQLIAPWTPWFSGPSSGYPTVKEFYNLLFPNYDQEIMIKSHASCFYATKCIVD